MTTIMDSPTRQITIGEQEYKVRRLNVRDAFATLKIISAVAEHSVENLKHAVDDEGNVNEQTLGIIIMTALPLCEDTVYELMASLINVEPEYFADQMPPSAPFEIVDYVVQTKDFEDFLRTLRHLMKAESSIKTVWRKLST